MADDLRSFFSKEAGINNNYSAKRSNNATESFQQPTLTPKSSIKKTSRWIPNDKESSYFSRLFKVADNTNIGKVIGEDAANFFRKSKLSEEILQKIWLLADTDNKGYLVQDEFNVALKLVSLSQNNLPFSAQNLNSESPLPIFSDISILEPLQQSYNYSIKIEEYNQYKSLFKANGGINDSLASDSAKDLLVKSKLSFDLLQKIWSLANPNSSNFLTLNSFIIAMYFLRRLMNGEITSLPISIPPSLIQSITSIATIVPPPATIVPKNDIWSLDDSDRVKFETQFYLLDSDKLGYITGDVAASYFMKSKLPEADLAKIWDLADTNNKGKLTKSEFVIALFIISKRISGSEIPSKVPTSLKSIIPPAEPAFLPKASQQKDLKSLNYTPNYSIDPKSKLEVVNLKNQINEANLDNSVNLKRRATINNQLAELEAEKQSLIVQLKSIIASTEAEKKIAQELELKLEEKNKEYKNLQYQIEIEKINLSEIENSVSDSQQKHAYLVNNITSLRNSLSIIHNKKTELRSELSQYIAQNSNLELQIQSESKLLANIEQSIKEETDKIDSLKAAIVSKKAKLSNLKESSSQKKIDLDSTRDQVNNLNSQYSTTNENFNDIFGLNNLPESNAAINNITHFAEQPRSRSAIPPSAHRTLSTGSPTLFDEVFGQSTSSNHTNSFNTPSLNANPTSIPASQNETFHTPQANNSLFSKENTLSLSKTAKSPIFSDTDFANTSSTTENVAKSPLIISNSIAEIQDAPSSPHADFNTTDPFLKLLNDSANSDFHKDLDSSSTSQAQVPMDVSSIDMAILPPTNANEISISSNTMDITNDITDLSQNISNQTNSAEPLKMSNSELAFTSIVPEQLDSHPHLSSPIVSNENMAVHSQSNDQFIPPNDNVFTEPSPHVKAEPEKTQSDSFDDIFNVRKSPIPENSDINKTTTLLHKTFSDPHTSSMTPDLDPFLSNISKSISNTENSKTNFSLDVKPDINARSIFGLETKPDNSDNIASGPGIKSDAGDKSIFSSELKSDSSNGNIFSSELKSDSSNGNIFSSELKSHASDRNIFSSELKSHTSDRNIFSSDPISDTSENNAFSLDVKPDIDDNMNFNKNDTDDFEQRFPAIDTIEQNSPEIVDIIPNISSTTTLPPAAVTPIDAQKPIVETSNSQNANVNKIDNVLNSDPFTPKPNDTFDSLIKETLKDPSATDEAKSPVDSIANLDPFSPKKDVITSQTLPTTSPSIEASQSVIKSMEYKPTTDSPFNSLKSDLPSMTELPDSESKKSDPASGTENPVVQKNNVPGSNLKSAFDSLFLGLDQTSSTLPEKKVLEAPSNPIPETAPQVPEKEIAFFQNFPSTFSTDANIEKSPSKFNDSDPFLAIANSTQVHPTLNRALTKNSSPNKPLFSTNFANADNLGLSEIEKSQPSSTQIPKQQDDSNLESIFKPIENNKDSEKPVNQDSEVRNSYTDILGTLDSNKTPEINPFTQFQEPNRHKSPNPESISLKTSNTQTSASTFNTSNTGYSEKDPSKQPTKGFLSKLKKDSKEKSNNRKSKFGIFSLSKRLGGNKGKDAETSNSNSVNKEHPELDFSAASKQIYQSSSSPMGTRALSDNMFYGVDQESNNYAIANADTILVEKGWNKNVKLVEMFNNLVSMGFDKEQVAKAMEMCDFDFSQTMEYLVST
ncbi:Epidermal growth factor receptor substrate 15 [Smittium culicis]|uniref:Epidermal growth factor receptor substrate 15 n=1 Tax=Smittium culicis TaxID=133412 RepID=A0A1R1XRR4_9FUNG|nr:Epidermal growth factor receptor substrate 15 [Smittium culicis]